MTPHERQLVDELFSRLATLENSPRELQAIAAINDGLKQAPNALYALVQTVLLQEEALKRAQARLEALGDAPEGQRGGFLDSMRDAVFGGVRRGSVPSVRPGDTGQNPWPAQQPQQPQQQGGFGSGGSFLGTAAAAAAGAIGGSLLMNSLGSMFGGDKAHAFGSTEKGGDKSPWNDNSGGELSRDAGLGDIGSQKGGERQGLFDQASNTSADGDGFDDDDFGDFTDGGGGD
jgi:hypothetical protein